MVRNFRGQVKIADVQEEFDNIVDRINTMVDNYNASLSIQDIDYTTAASSLSPSGYCLTVGGLKQLINDFDGTVIGCKAYKISDTQVKVTGGLLFCNGKVYRINDRVISTATGSVVYYDIDNKRLTFGASSGTTTTWTNYTIPNFTSASTFGQISANYNSANAYKARKNSAGAWNSGWNMGNVNNYLYSSDASKARTLTWTFPNGVRLSSGKLTVQIAVERYQQATYTIIGLIVNGGSRVDGVVSWNGATGTATWNISNGTLTSLKLVIMTLGGIGQGWNMYMDSINLTGVQKQTIVNTGETVGTLVKVADLNMARTIKYANTIPKAQISGNTKYRYAMSKKAYGRINNMASAESFSNSSQGNFYIADIKWVSDGQTIKLLNTNVEKEVNPGGRTYNSNRMYSPLYVPKGLSVPYTYSDTSSDIHKARTATKKTS